MSTDPAETEDECYRRVRAAHRWLTVGEVAPQDRIKGAAQQLDRLAREMGWQIDPPIIPSSRDRTEG